MNNATNEINHRYFDSEISFAVDREDCEFYDDCMVHIVRGGFDYVFYNGENPGSRLLERDVPRMRDVVDKHLKAVAR